MLAGHFGGAEHQHEPHTAWRDGKCQHLLRPLTRTIKIPEPESAESGPLPVGVKATNVRFQLRTTRRWPGWRVAVVRPEWIDRTLQGDVRFCSPSAAIGLDSDRAAGLKWLQGSRALMSPTRVATYPGGSRSDWRSWHGLTGCEDRTIPLLRRRTLCCPVPQRQRQLPLYVRCQHVEQLRSFRFLPQP